MKKTLTFVLLLAMLLTVLSGCGTTSTQSSSDSTAVAEPAESAEPAEAAEAADSVDDTVYTLKVGNVLTTEDPITIGLQLWADNVKERTDGHVLIEVCPNSTLGDSVEVLEQIVAGSEIGVMSDTGMLADYVPDMAIYTAPYIFSSVENAREFIETDIFKAWDEELTKYGIHDLGCNWYQGARNFLTNTPVETPDDLKGLRVRTMGTQVAQESMKALGCVPTSLAWSEVYNGMSSNVIDALEAQTTAVYGASLQEVTKYITRTEHFLLYTALTVSQSWWDSLPAEYQQIVEEEAVAAGDYATEMTRSLEQDYFDAFTEQGVTITEVDKTPFIEASASVYETMGWTDLKAQIDEMLGQ